MKQIEPFQNVMPKGLMIPIEIFKNIALRADDPFYIFKELIIPIETFKIIPKELMISIETFKQCCLQS